MTAFSVLLPVYAGDDPAFFARALRSVSTCLLYTSDAADD